MRCTVVDQAIHSSITPQADLKPMDIFPSSSTSNKYYTLRQVYTKCIQCTTSNCALPPACLQISLACTLEHYAPLAGRIVPNEDCARSPGQSSSHTTPEPWSPPLGLPLTHGRGMRQSWALCKYRARLAFHVVLCNAGAFIRLKACHFLLRAHGKICFKPGAG